MTFEIYQICTVELVLLLFPLFYAVKASVLILRRKISKNK